MKKLLPIFFLLISLNLSAQDSTYVPFDFDSSQWYNAYYRTAHDWPENPPDVNGDYILQYGGDTIFNGIPYKVITRNEILSHNIITDSTILWYTSTAGFIREEAKKVYAINIDYNWPIQHNEFLLYDFTLEIGDTFKLQDSLWWYGGMSINSLNMVVIEKDSIQLNDNYRNRLKLVSATRMPNSPPNNHLYTFEDLNTQGYGDTIIYWIDGMGSNYGLFYNYTLSKAHGFESWEWNKFLCFHQNDSLLYSIADCYFYTATTGIEEKTTKQITIYPNPANNTINLQLPQTLTTGNIQLYNTTGRLVGSYPLSVQIDVSHLSNGMYYLRLQSEGEVYSQKVLISK